MKRQIKINYNLWMADDSKKKIPMGHQECLEKDALGYILGQLRQGFTEGQLFDRVGEIEYTGYWKSETI